MTVWAPRVAILGLPTDAGAGQRGAVMGPTALRIAGLADGLRALGLDVVDHGDLAAPPPIDVTPPPGRVHHLGEVAAWSRAIATAAEALMQPGTLPIFLGGDHGVSMGTITGLARHATAAGRALVVLWMDAHADFNTPATSPTGNMHGMATAQLTGQPGLEAVFGEPGPPALPLNRLHLFGIRSIDAEERYQLRAKGVDVADMRLIDEFGVGVLLRRVLEQVVALDALLHVSLDVDFLDPAIAPGVGTAVQGGATYREAHLLMEMLHDSGRVTSLDVVELNPFLDVRGQSAVLLVELVASLFGRRIIER